MSRHAIDRGELALAIEAFIRRKYAISSDKRQRDMGLSYVTAEVKDLADELADLVPILLASDLIPGASEIVDEIPSPVRH